MPLFVSPFECLRADRGIFLGRDAICRVPVFLYNLYYRLTNAHIINFAENELARLGE